MKNKVLKVITVVIGFAFTGNCLFAQNEYEPGKIWVIVNHDSIVPSKGHKASSAQFNLILQDFDITNVKQIMPFAKTKQN